MTHNTSLTRRWPARAIWTAVSQAASSVTNLVLLLTVARTGDDIDVGRIALVAIAYQVCIGTTRALLGEVALVRHVLVGRLESARMVRSTVSVGGVLGACLLLMGLLGGDDVRAFAVLGISFPVLVVQDSLRYVSFATETPRRAACADLGWLALFVGATVVITSAGWGTSTSSLLALWAACGAASIFVLDVRSVLGAYSVRSRWIRESGRLSRAYLADFAITLATTVMPTLIVAVVGGIPTAGKLRLALSYLGPIAILWVALVNFATPVLARSPRTDLRFERRVSVAAVCAVVVWTLAGLVVPDAAGERFAGSSWPAMQAWLPWLGLGFSALGSYGGAVVGLRTRDAADKVVRARAAMVVPAVALPSLGFALWQQGGFGSGMAIAGGATSALLWRELQNLDARRRQGSLA